LIQKSLDGKLWLLNLLLYLLVQLDLAEPSQNRQCMLQEGLNLSGRYLNPLLAAISGQSRFQL